MRKAVLGFLWLVVERSAVGQKIQAVGGDPTTACLSGIDVDRVKTLGFVASGVCAALTGVLLASRLGSGTPSAADGYLFVLARRGTDVVPADTGFMNEGSGAGMRERFGIPEWIPPLRMLAEPGVRPEDVTHILLSHAHFGHHATIKGFRIMRV